MTSDVSGTATQFALSTRMLAATLMGALVFIGIALFFVLGTQDDGLAAPSLLVPLVQVAAAVAVHVVLEAVGYRADPLDPSLPEDDAARKAREVWQTGMILRFALSEFIAIASIAAAFIVAEGGYVTYLFGAIVSLALMFLHVWPGARPVGKVAAALEERGQSSHLRETFGVA